MLIPLISLYLLFMAYGESYAFTEFLLSWLKVDLRVIAMFLAAPIPPIVALVVYMEIAKVLNMLELDKLKRVTGLEGLASLGVLKVLGIGYAAGVTINALIAIGEEIGWRAYLTPALISHAGVTATIIIVGIVWGLWHIPINLSVKHVFEKSLPWISLRWLLLSSVISFTIFSYPLYLLLITSNSILPPAAFHGTINALWRLPQFVTRISNERRSRDLIKVTLVSIMAWGIAIAVTIALIKLINSLI